jgi:hypothetical protein
MKNKWIFFALVPLFSYAAVEEEWLSETTFPKEVEASEQKTREISASRQGARTYSRSKRSEPAYRKKSFTSDEMHDEDTGESRWTAFLERLTLKKAPKKGLNIVTNRKHNLSLSEEDDALEEEREEEQERPAVKHHYKAREKISAESDRREREMSVKRKSELSRKNSRRLQRDMD